MSAYKYMRSFIKKVSGQDNILTIPKVYIEITGDINTALILNQAIYYSSITKRKDGFFYKTYRGWEEETGLSQYQVSRSVKKLENMDLLETKLKRAEGSPTLHYKVLMDNLQDLIINKLNNGLSRNLIIENEETSQTRTKTYTETYTSSSSNAFAFYENNFGMMSPFISQNIEHWIDDLSEELVIEAMKIALKNNKQFNYAEGILRDWHKRNIRTIDDVAAARKEFERKRNPATRKREVADFEID